MGLAEWLGAPAMAYKKGLDSYGEKELAADIAINGGRS
jgi:hypothetical protein